MANDNNYDDKKGRPSGGQCSCSPPADSFQTHPWGTQLSLSSQQILQFIYWAGYGMECPFGQFGSQPSPSQFFVLIRGRA